MSVCVCECVSECVSECECVLVTSVIKARPQEAGQPHCIDTTFLSVAT